jgi:predicted ATPase
MRRHLSSALLMRASARCLASCALRLRYDSLLASGALRPDAAQAACVERLSTLHAALGAHRVAVVAHEQALAAHAAAKQAHLARLLAEEEARCAAAAPAPAPAAPRGFFAGLLTPQAAPQRTAVDAEAAEAAACAAVGPPPAPPVPPRGVYLHGGVGVGKTLLLDLFTDAAVEALGERSVRRVHFNAFSNDVHYHLHKREQQRREQQQPAEQAAAAAATTVAHAARAALLAARRRRGQVASNNAASSSLAPTNASVLADVASAVLPGAASPAVLCFDEFEVRDAFTAVALKGVLEALLARGATLLFTSNRALHEVQGGAAQQRELFAHFATTLAERCDAWPLSTATDYRTACAAVEAAPSRLRFAPSSSRALDELHAAVCAGEAPAPQTLPVLFGRQLRVARACNGVARLHFEELCALPLGSADFIALASSFHTVFLDGVPRMPAGSADLARRFITLLDELYNARCALVLAAEAAPEELFCSDGDEAPLVELEALQFESAAEGARSRRDVTLAGGVAPLGSAAAAAALGGAAERFAFKRAVSRLAEMGTASWVRRSRSPLRVQDALLGGVA